MGVSNLGASETKRLRREGEISDLKRGQTDMMSMALMHQSHDSDTSRGNAVSDLAGINVGQAAVANELRAIANDNARRSHRSSHRKSARKSVRSNVNEAEVMDEELANALDGLNRRNYY